MMIKSFFYSCMAAFLCNVDTLDGCLSGQNISECVMVFQKIIFFKNINSIYIYIKYYDKYV